MKLKFIKKLGPELLEKIYEECLKYELEQNGHNVKQQINIEVDYYEKHSATSYIISEEVEMARQTNDNLESYIKQKHHIESYFVSENINLPKVTRYKIEKY